FRLLCLMVMIWSCIYVKFLESLASKRVLRKHPFDSQFKHFCWVFRAHFTSCTLFQAACVLCVAIVNFVCQFVPCKVNLLSVDDDHVITSVNVWCECWFVFTA